MKPALEQGYFMLELGAASQKRIPAAFGMVIRYDATILLLNINITKTNQQY